MIWFGLLNVVVEIVSCAVSVSLELGVGVLVSDCELDLADAPLQTHQVLVQLRLFLLQSADLIVQFHIFNLLLRQISLQLILNTKHTLQTLCLNYLPVSFELKSLTAFVALGC